MLYGKKLLHFCYSLLIFATCCYGIYNTNELQNVEYDLEIAEIPFGFENFKFDDERLMQMIPKNTLQVIKNFHLLQLQKLSSRRIENGKFKLLSIHPFRITIQKLLTNICRILINYENFSE